MVKSEPKNCNNISKPMLEIDHSKNNTDTYIIYIHIYITTYIVAMYLIKNLSAFRICFMNGYTDTRPEI